MLKKIRNKLRNNFGVGDIMLFSSMAFIIVLAAHNVNHMHWVRFWFLEWLFTCWITDNFCRNHLIWNRNVHGRLEESEEKLFASLSKQQQIDLVNWYGSWLALFTGSYGRLFDLCAFQIAGSSKDLIEFASQHNLSITVPEIVIDVSKHWSLADEQVFKIYYGSMIKRSAAKRLFKLQFHQRQNKGLRMAYLDHLLDSYGKQYCEYGIFLNNLIRDGHDVRSTFETLHSFNLADQPEHLSLFARKKMLVTGSVYSLKEILANKKDS